MNKKQLLERQITKEFLNESLDLNESNQDGAYTTQLKKTGKGLVGSIASALLPGSDVVSGVSSALQNLFKSDKYKELKDNMDPKHYSDLSEVLKLIDNLQKYIEPDIVNQLYAEDKENFAVNLVNKALERVHIKGNQYKLSSPQEGFQTIHNLKRPGK